MFVCDDNLLFGEHSNKFCRNRFGKPCWNARQKAGCHPIQTNPVLLFIKKHLDIRIPPFAPNNKKSPYLTTTPTATAIQQPNESKLKSTKSAIRAASKPQSHNIRQSPLSYSYCQHYQNASKKKELLDQKNSNV